MAPVVLPHDLSPCIQIHTGTGAAQSGDTDLCVDQPDELVKVLEPHVGILIMEVTTHGHHDVVGAVGLTLWGKGSSLTTLSSGHSYV